MLEIGPIFRHQCGHFGFCWDPQIRGWRRERVCGSCRRQQRIGEAKAVRQERGISPFEVESRGLENRLLLQWLKLDRKLTQVLEIVEDHSDTTRREELFYECCVEQIVSETDPHMWELVDADNPLKAIVAVGGANELPATTLRERLEKRFGRVGDRRRRRPPRPEDENVEEMSVEERIVTQPQRRKYYRRVLYKADLEWIAGREETISKHSSYEGVLAGCFQLEELAREQGVLVE